MNYNPQQGDIITMDFTSTKGHEQRGHRPAVVVSNASFNNFARGVALVCTVTNTDRNIAVHIKLDDRTATKGVIMTDQQHHPKGRCCCFGKVLVFVPQVRGYIPLIAP